MCLKKKLISIFLVTLIVINLLPIRILAGDTNEEIITEDEVFFDDFSGDGLDTSKWLIADKAWGGGNGGVVPQNVSVSNGTLKLEGHGDNYTGDIPGVHREDGTRTGAAVATRDYFGSGSYEVVAKVAPELGVCSAIWTFEYEEYYPGDEKYEELGATGSYYVVNHEIDIEMPGRPSNGAEPSYEYALCNTWVGEKGGEYTTGYTKLPQAQNDGEFHTYRFDWHTGDDNETKRVDFWFDGELITTNYEHVPTNEGRLWIGLWFPNGWAGKDADFDTTVFEIDSVKITPYHEAGDTEQNETYAKDGWAAGSFTEDEPTDEEKQEKLSFNVELKSDKAEVKKGDIFTVTAAISNLIKNSSNGLMAIGGKLEYDTNLLEIDLDSIRGLNTWSMNKQDFNPDNFKFVTDSGDFVTNAGDIFTVNFKVKENIDVEDIMLKLTSIQGGTAQLENGIVLAEDSELHIAIQKDEEIEIPAEINSDKYDIGENYITKIEPNTTVSEFISNVSTNSDLVFTDAEGNALGNDSIIKTGDKLKVGTTLNFELVVMGDVDGDGFITVTDLAMMKLHCININTLEGVQFEAAKLDEDELVTVNDVAIIKLVLISNT